MDAVALAAREATAKERAAHELAATGGGDARAPRCKQACGLLRQAAGVWDALGANAGATAIARLDALPAGCALAAFDARPPEAARAVCSGAALAAAAGAQRMMIGAALATTGLPDSLGAKLCGGVAERLDASRDASRDGAPKHHARLDPERGGRARTLPLRAPPLVRLSWPQA